MSTGTAEINSRRQFFTLTLSSVQVSVKTRSSSKRGEPGAGAMGKKRAREAIVSVQRESLEVGC